MIQAGDVVKICGLKSIAGKELNNKRAAMINYLESEDRWKVRVEMEPISRAIKAIKANNLQSMKRLPLPTGPHRGITMVDTNINQKLCELLVYYKGGGPNNYRGDFQPSEIVFSGYAAIAFSRMGESNFMNFTCVQIEQMGGVLALANICREAKEPGAESVLFAFLEGDPMYIDVLIQTLHWTGFIAEDGVEKDFDAFNIPPSMLTPDQDSAPYVQTMSEGPVLLFNEITKHVFGPSFSAAVQKSEFYHLLIQRLLRLTAREVLGTRDGKSLGKKVRQILGRILLFEDFDLTQGMISKTAADNILENVSSSLTTPAAVTEENINHLLKINKN